jgi:hypothetical protein
VAQVILFRAKPKPLTHPPLDLTGLRLWYDFRNTLPGVQTIPDLSGNGADLQRGGTGGADATDPALNAADGLVFDGSNDYAVCDSSKLATVCALGSPLYELIFRETIRSGDVFTLGQNVDGANSHGGMQIWPSTNQIQFIARRASDGATLQANAAFGALPPTGTWIYVAYHAGARQFAFRWNGGSLNGAVGANYGVSTVPVDLHFGTYNANGSGGRLFAGAIRHFAIYNANQRFGAGAAMNTEATNQYAVFQAAGYLP